MIDQEQYIPFVLKLATPYARANRISVRDSEFFADGCLGLAKAADTFDPDRGTSFMTYASYYIGGEIMDGIKRRSTTKKYENGVVVRSTCTGQLMDMESDDSQPVSQSASDREEVDRLRNAVDRLPAKFRQVIDMRLEGNSVADIARLLGVSRQRAEVIVKNAMSEICRKMRTDYK